MPSETIIKSDNSQFTVGWAKQGSSLDPAVTLSDWRAELDPNGAFSAWKPSSAYRLDRDGINRLIRVLRRARDQAYGLDE